jgi:hypothetical protein
MDNAQQQIVDGITTTSNILVTVSSNPSVDELSAALGLTLVLDKLDKRATAIFSGAMPPAITFLEPNKTFEPTADSLQDFIIALNKEKADHLRYKVDGDVVKIFITPYKTTLSQTDLEFSQGDYNVEMVIALGVKDQDHLDNALAAHGKILHDAKVMTITAGPDKSTLGSNDWHDDKASSLSEMVVSLVNALKSSVALLDQQTSTALLTGIVSSTDRFSNDKTSSQVMTLAAQLMAAGANQQLIAAKLQEFHDIAPQGVAPIAAGSGDAVSSDGTELTIERDEKAEAAPVVSPMGEKVIEPLAPPPPSEPAPAMSTEDTDQVELEKQLAGITTAAPTGTMADIEKELQEAAMSAGGVTTPAVGGTPVLPPISDTATVEPSSEFTGQHGPVGFVSPAEQPAMNGIMAGDEEEPTVDPFNTSEALTHAEGATIAADAGTPDGAAILAEPPKVVVSSDPVTTPAEPIVPTLPTIPATQPTEPVIPELPSLPPLPPLPTDGSVPPLPPPPPPPPVFTPGAAQAGAVAGDIFGDTSAAPAAPAPTVSEPGQFKIPGQS